MAKWACAAPRLLQRGSRDLVLSSDRLREGLLVAVAAREQGDGVGQLQDEAGVLVCAHARRVEIGQLEPALVEVAASEVALAAGVLLPVRLHVVEAVV
eukprot:635448-Prymnesium_polylepis.2